MKRVVIEGIREVSSDGAVLEGQRWHGVAVFRPWRLAPNGRLSNEPLHVSLQARRTSAEARRDAKRVKVGVYYRFAASLHPRRPNMLTSADLRGTFEAIAGDNALVTRDAELSKTVRVKDPVLGTLVRPPHQQQFRGNLKLFGRGVPMYVDGSVARASALLARLRRDLRAMPGSVARKMVPLANRSWLDQPISERELRRRLKPTEVWLVKNAMQISFSCGDTFGDHGITVTINSRGTTRRIRLL